MSTVKKYVDTHHKEIFQEFLAYASIPDLHGDNKNLTKNAELLKSMLDKRGMHGELWPAEGGAPVVYGEKIVPGAKHTLLFYIHFDGQPIEPKRWAQPDPFVPVVRTGTIEEGGKTITDPLAAADVPGAWRIYARGSGDDKLPGECVLGAIDALGPNLKENVKVFFHGEEEGGGPSMNAAFANHADKLKDATLLIILDGPQHSTGRPTMYYGARGGANVNVTVFTAKNSMHSGNYGNWLPDANVRMAQLISSMVDATGKVVIEHFYDDVLPFSKSSEQMMDAVPENSAQMQKDYGVGSLDGAAKSLQFGLNMPTFSIHKIEGGEEGSVIAAKSTAEIAMRLVKENDPSVMAKRVIDHIKKQGYFIVDKDPDVATLAAHPRIAKVTSRSLQARGGTGAWRTDAEQPEAAFAKAALDKAWPGKMVYLRTLGGGVPAGPFIDKFGFPVIGIALANYDDNQHSDNENAKMGNIYDGIITLAGLISQ
ncbi:M20/M25/M40 family metallo-hydrolase [Terriglobus tenax]|uniref:M20/M25/M40 family metallo-hydrolase n=1 Tax=Terriglobus tenax TaxID=1111115 RepID=UPI0021E04E2E|nr:M20/M25/M40 family metallo-hydrolase [Terriglobus tenax]